MNSAKNKIWLYREIAAYVVLAVVLAIFVHYQLSDTPSSTPIDPAVGQVYSAYIGLGTEAEEYSVILALSPDCPFCMMSMDFYKHIVDDEHKYLDNIGVYVIVASEALLESERIALKNAGVNINNVLSMDFSSLDLQGVPSILVVNRRGVVLHYWKGLLDNVKEQEVKDVLKELSQS